MTQKEKARAYDKVSKEVKDFFEGKQKMYNDVNQTLEYLFPELKESEDEKIRNALIKGFNECLVSSSHYPKNAIKYWHGIVIEDIVAWLEKQESVGEIMSRCKASWFNEGKIQGQIEGLSDEEKYQQGWHDALEKQSEQKSADKVEPKFKVGDWCIDNEDGAIFQIVKVLDNTYTYKTNEGKEYSCTHYSLENDAKLWTIQDAKDSDVLVSKHNQPFIYNGIFDEESVGAYCGIDCLGDDFLESTFSCDWSYKEGVKPATKEQCDLLFQKMKEAGYEWDAEKKELKLLITNGGDFFESENCEQKHVEWSEEDKRICNNIINDITNDKSICKYEIAKGICDEQINWLKSLKERMADNHPNLTWEDIRKIYLIAKNVHKYYGFWTQNIYEEILDRFNKPEVWT